MKSIVPNMCYKNFRNARLNYPCMGLIVLVSIHISIILSPKASFNFVSPPHLRVTIGERGASGIVGKHCKRGVGQGSDDGDTGWGRAQGQKIVFISQHDNTLFRHASSKSSRCGCVHISKSKVRERHSGGRIKHSQQESLAHDASQSLHR